MKIDGRDSIVLLTNYHVMTPEKYKKAMPTEISSIKPEIEEYAESSKIKLEDKTIICLSKGILVKQSSIFSPIKSVCL